MNTALHRRRTIGTNRISRSPKSRAASSKARDSRPHTRRLRFGGSFLEDADAVERFYTAPEVPPADDEDALERFYTAPEVPLPFDDETLRIAVREWLHDPATAEVQYGHISDWDTSRVRDMSRLFRGDTSHMFYVFPELQSDTDSEFEFEFSKYMRTVRNTESFSSFNQPLKWDTSNVTDMSHMFDDATAFNQPLPWNTSKVRNMESMFYNATSFNQPLPWNTSNVWNMESMFRSATKFNQPLPWNTSKVQDMVHMFEGARAFNQPLQWNTSNVTDMREMFRSARAFNQPLKWDTRQVEDMVWMFLDAPLMLRRYQDGERSID